jgi:hypothetical protein
MPARARHLRRASRIETPARSRRGERGENFKNF